MNKGRLLVVFFLFVSAVLCAQNAAYKYGFYGRVSLEKLKGVGVTVNLYDNNTIISTYLTTKNGKFSIDAPEGKHYTLEFVKDGYVTKRVIINTKLQEGSKVEQNDFAFDVLMIKREEDVDYSILDFPVALIEYRKNRRSFDYNKKYTRRMHDIQNEVVARVFTQL